MKPKPMKTLPMAMLMLLAVCGCKGEKGQRQAADGSWEQKNGPADQVVSSQQQSSVQQRVSALLEEGKMRKAVITPRDVMRKVEIVKELGDLRAVEAAPFLAENISKIGPQEISGTDYIHDSPCVPALVKIGEPAVPAILELFDKDAAREDKLLFVLVLRDIKGRKWTYDFLQGKIGSEKDDQKRKRLKNLIGLASEADGSPPREDFPDKGY